MTQRSISPRQMARAIGASESSLKRWIDSGEIPALRTIGGHRRIPLDEALRFVRDRRLTLVNPGLLTSPAPADATRAAAARSSFDQRLPPRAARTLHGPLIAGDAKAVEELLMSWFASGVGIGEMADRAIAPAMARIGMLWQHGPEGIATEHRATAALVRAVAVIQSILPETKGPLALGGAPSGDPYILPSMLVSTALLGAGWRVANLGPDLPAEALASAIASQRPRIVWLSMTAPVSQRTAQTVTSSAAGQCAAVGAELIVGGRAAPRADRQTSWHAARSIGNLLSIARRWGAPL